MRPKQSLNASESLEVTPLERSYYSEARLFLTSNVRFKATGASLAWQIVQRGNLQHGNLKIKGVP